MKLKIFYIKGLDNWGIPAPPEPCLVVSKTKLKPADEKFLTKFLGDKLDFNSFDTEKITRKNPYSGMSCEVDPICAVLETS